MTETVFNRDATIQDLEASDWGEPRFASAVVRASHALRRKRLRDLTDEELRLGIGQQIGLRYLVPLALERLRAGVFLAVRYHEGDLLANVLNVPTEFWDAHLDLRAEVAELAGAFLAGHAARPDASDRALEAVTEATARFTGKLPARRWLRVKEDGRFF